ncbi:fimbria/pilus outer membrane usher protein [Citrobacter rodentium]|uniref:Fimbrial usher protein n=2 Tax=Citrobacter rodentium TaxID=67825 RepID=D2TLZ4_CITRI|nr:fimbria/pilus outer membrane usher protein [Citrobacter rodentium]KIQ50752.1 fimbrial assembly protein [Citrobacter rodentium]QBY31971.1 fimbrial biogenesis outer membrane usher protein [Citrobacter rodentium]UHO33537.1 fimbrial biogenesis outer membrane usher protein [Citrobacter rodentium NBRC 105723 = DSM 16636]CBG88571.1 putative fimbrial usher protein [Citrobacter rodentium ICC168]
MITSLLNEARGRDYFNPALLENNPTAADNIDLSAFETGQQAQGTYRVDIILNGANVDTREIAFFPGEEGDLEPCLSEALLQRYGVKTASYPGLMAKGKCADLAAIPQASSELLFSAQKLLLTIPQAALSAQARGYVAPELWDEGISAVMLNYSFSGDRSRTNADGVTSNSQYASLRPGINVGPWRLRNYTTWNRDSQGNDNWDTVYTYLQRNIVPLKAQLVLGDSASPADIFDSIPFRGAQLASDDEMLPDSLKGYAPVVRGIARSHAQVIIRQNGYQIYQSYVAPGAFEISDLYPTGGAGDLDVTLKEADGGEQHFTVPFASLPVLQREGRVKYALTAGRYRSYDSRVAQSGFAQGTTIYGLPAAVTVYGGLQAADDYRAVAAGAGKNFGVVGALSTDLTRSWSQPRNAAKAQGQSWRIRYSKNSVLTGTHFAIAGYRYSTRDFYAMEEVFTTRGGSNTPAQKRRNRMEANVSQSLGQGRGALSLSAVREEYWNRENPMQSWSVSYNNAWNGVSYGISWTQSKNSLSGTDNRYEKDQQIAFNVSVPLEGFMANSWAHYSLNGGRNAGTTHSAGLSGMALADNALNWNLQQGYGSDGVGYTGSLNADYKGTYAQVSSGYSYDSNMQRLNYALAGALLAHADGVTLSQPLGETNVLIKAPGANGVGVKNQRGVKTDFRGYTVAGNVSPYRNNDIGLDTLSVPANVELELTNKNVVPTRGAVVRAEFVASVGLRLLLTLHRDNGRPVPFGARVVVQGAQGPGFIVGDDGQVYLSGMQPQGELDVAWGDDPQQRCTVEYSFKAAVGSGDIITDARLCR